MRYWRRVEPGLARLGTVVLYNRALPAVDRSALPPLGAYHAEELNHLLDTLNRPGPALLVAHSMGGLYADLFARLHPERVCGLVLVDASHPQQEHRFEPGMNRFGRWFRGLIAGWDRLFGPGAMTEIARFSSIGAEIAAAPPFPPIPLTVITAGRTPPNWLISSDLWAIHLANQRELASQAPGGRHIVAEASDHHIPVRQPDIIVEAVRDMILQMKKGPA